MKRKPMLVADLFCGAGGSSSGARKALERQGIQMQLVAVNHWPVAIDTHQANHPDARHYCVNLDSARPQEIVPEGYLDLLMASPECTHHSRARGGKPMTDQKRSSVNRILDWVDALYVRRILIENVPEFLEWGPLGVNGLPLKSKKGVLFRGFVRSLEERGYKVEWRILNAADYGDATTRQRLFLMARRDRKPIQWPEPTHGQTAGIDLFGHVRQPWRSAREIIDWSVPSPSIFSRKRPLKPNTIKRIAAGLQRFGGIYAEPFLAILYGMSNVRSVDEPIPTVTAGGGNVALVQTSLQPFVCANRTNNVPKNIDQPVPTIVTSGSLFLTQPTLTPFTLGQQSGSIPREVENPLPTIATGGAISLVEPFIAKVNHGDGEGSCDRRVRSLDQPIGGITTKRGDAIVEPFITPYYGSSSGVDVNDPLDTVTTRDRFALVQPFIVPQFSGAVPRSTEDPMGVITTTSRGIGLAEPFLVPQFGEREGQTPRSHSLDAPLPAPTSHGAGALVEPIAEHVDNEATGGRVVEIDGERYLLDIRFRMLQNHELARAMGFSDNETEYEFTGNKTEITKQIGNAVCVNLAAALVGAFFAEKRGAE